MLNQLRRLLYLLAGFLGDVNAVSKGKVGRRIVRKAAYRRTGRVLRKWLK